MNGTGTAILDFGSGLNETSVSVTGLSTITSTSKVEAWVMTDSTSDHTANDHKYFSILASLICSVPVDGVGFTIYGVSQYKLTGTFQIRYVWTN